MSTSFDLDQFIADCRAACEADPSHKLVREVVARAVPIRRAFSRVSASRSAPKSRNSISPTVDYPQRDLGAEDDDHAPRSPHVGGHRPVHRP